MKWIRLPSGDHQAIGRNGDYLVWREGKLWRSRYWNNERTIHFLLPRKPTLTEAKAQCEDNRYWEE